MARTKTAMPKLRLARSGGGRRKLIALLVLGAVVYWVIKDPVGAADFVSTVWNGFGEFFSNLQTTR
jgi:hypothetical protein